MLRGTVLLVAGFGSSGAVLAGCGGGLEAEETVARVYIGMGDCEYAEETIVVGESGRTPPKTFRFADECDWDKTAMEPKQRGHEAKASYFRSFSCRLRGGSPLAGMRYAVAFDWKRKDGCGHIPRVTYVCTQGCSKNAPQVFLLLPVDCDD